MQPKQAFWQRVMCTPGGGGDAGTFGGGGLAIGGGGLLRGGCRRREGIQLDDTGWQAKASQSGHTAL